jgi:hypothetical protein
VTATIINLAEARTAARGAPPAQNDDFDRRQIPYGVLLRISLKLGLSLEPEQHAFLHRWGHLLP